MRFGQATLDIRADARPLAIAEIGVNHNGSVDLCKSLILSAHAAGADVVKLQAFVSEEEISRYAAKCDYQVQTTGDAGTQLEMAKALELDFSQLRELARFCDESRIPWLFTAFESRSLEFLVRDLRIGSLKIASSEITNLPFLAEIGALGLDVILSSGASTMDEVATAVEALRSAGAREIVLLHCVSSYPAPLEELNLAAIPAMHRRFGLPVGFSDHTDGALAAGLAVACGACVIEKHITFDTRMPGPDHLASITPDVFSGMVRGMRTAFSMRGDGVKRPVPCEMTNLPLIRKSIVARHTLRAGHVLRLEDLAFKRPGTGIPPGHVKELLGRRLARDFEPDEPLNWEGMGG